MTTAHTHLVECAPRVAGVFVGKKKSVILLTSFHLTHLNSACQEMEVISEGAAVRLLPSDTVWQSLPRYSTFTSSFSSV